MKTKNYREISIKFENVSAVVAETLAEELAKRLRRADEGIEVKRVKSDPDTQGLGDLLIIIIHFIDSHSEHAVTLIEQILAKTLMDFLTQKGVDIELESKIGKVIQKIGGKTNDAKQQLENFLKKLGKKSDSVQEEPDSSKNEKEKSD